MVKSQVNSDSNAARGIASRIGSGKVRHLQIRDLWVQERVRSGELQLGKVGTDVNRSDMGTKYLDGKRIEKLMEMASLRIITKGLIAGMVINTVRATSTECAVYENYQYKDMEKGVLMESARNHGIFVVMIFVAIMVLIVACYVECRLARIVRKGVADAQRPIGQPQVMVKGKGAAKTAPATGQEGSKGSAAATPAPTTLGKGMGREAAAFLSRATVPELKEELAWRSLPVSGVKQDLVERLSDKSLERTWTAPDGFTAAVWGERVCGVKAPLSAFRSDERLALWILKVLPARRR